ncbi:hypothetical protein ZHAS_00018775 [Anopheles sinensis]|uniref:Uncharacterized protein n=1 Tax=Anopheles sinensis TaxID=74873 RepID=A0A084WKI6_ANOSI|nr:hypothetical protein ZHAS_00018775 [Anopheles sinensis]
MTKLSHMFPTPVLSNTCMRMVIIVPAEMFPRRLFLTNSPEFCPDRDRSALSWSVGHLRLFVRSRECTSLSGLQIINGSRVVSTESQQKK